MSDEVVQGRLNLSQLGELVASDKIETVVVAMTDLYGRLVGKRLDAGFFVAHAAASGTHACDYLLTVDMEMEPVAGYDFANWQRGYGDVHLAPDLATLRVASWLEKTAIVLCDVIDTKSHESVAVAPRSILRRQVDRLAAAGMQAYAASELEYYLLTDSYRTAAEKGHAGLTAAGWYLEDYHILQGTRGEPFHGAARRHLRRSDIPVESSKGEWGLGQHEVNIQFADVLTMADRHTIFKQCLKETADQAGVSVTFMAKLEEKQAGSSCHMHLSLWQDGTSALAGDEPFGPIRASDRFRWFVGGWMAHVAEMMVFYAPNVNSYKRYRAASWAPTRIAWCLDNRTSSFRIVGSGKSLRCECRLPGADCNPYLAYAAALASGLDGIERKIEPPPVFEGDAYAADDLPLVPLSLTEATEHFTGSRFVAETFGEDVVRHYAHFFRTEQAAYDDAVTDWERRRYFERI